MAKGKKNNTKAEEKEAASPSPVETEEEEQFDGHGIEDYRLKNDKNWFAFFGKLIFFVSAFFLVIFTLLSIMGGKSDTLKQIPEQVASNLFGDRPAKIEKLHNMSFFPSIALVFEGLKVLPYPESTEEIVSVGLLNVKVGFFDVLLGNARFKTLKIDDFKIKEGVFMQRDFWAESFYIDHDMGKNSAFLKGMGDFGPYKWDMAFALDIFGSGNAYKYKIDSDMAIQLNVADINISGDLKAEHSQYVYLNKLEISSRDVRLKGGLSMSAVSEGVTNMRGELKVENSDAVIGFDMKIDIFKKPRLISGSVKLLGFQDKDLSGKKSVSALIDRFIEIFVHEDVLGKYVQNEKTAYLMNHLSTYDYDLSVEIEKAAYKAFDGEGNVFIHLKKEMGHYYLSGIHGNMGGAPIKVPDMFIVNKGNEEGHTMLVTQEQSTVDLVSLVQNGISSDIVAAPKDNLECAAYGLSRNEDGAWIASSQNVAADNPVAFSEENYKFVSSILLGRGANDPCMAFITKE